MRLDPGKRTSGFERRVRAPKAQFGTRMQRLSWDELRRVFALEGYDQQLLPSQMPLDSAFGPRCAKGSPGGALLEAPDAWPGRLGVHLVSHTDSSTTSAPEAEVQKVPPPMAEPSLLEEFQKDLPSQASKPSLPKAMPWLPAPSVPKAKIQNVPHCMAEPSLLEEFRAPNGLLPAWPNTSGSQQPAAAKATPWVPSAAPSLPCAKVPAPMAEPSLLEELNKDLPAWTNTSGSQQPAAAKAMPWVPSAAPSLPCAKAALQKAQPEDLPSWPRASLAPLAIPTTALPPSIPGRFASTGNLEAAQRWRSSPLPGQLKRSMRLHQLPWVRRIKEQSPNGRGVWQRLLAQVMPRRLLVKEAAQIHLRPGPFCGAERSYC
eukprot:s1799_g7.t1